LVPNTPIFLQITSAVEADLVEGQILLEEQTMDIEYSLIYRAVSKRTGFRAKVKLNKEQRFEVIQ
jgi:hypothetical protein